MEHDDAEARIADLERQLAEQKRIAELEHQLAQAKSDANAGGPPDDEPARRYAQDLFESLKSGRRSGGPPGQDVAQLREALTRAATEAGVPQEQLDAALQRGNVTITSRADGYPGQVYGSGQRRRQSLPGASVIGGLAGALGLCVGGAAALTAVLPSTALWTSAIVCGGPNQLMVNTSHYSYKPGQSGSTVAFQCLESEGASDASFLAIGALQSVVVALVLVGVLAGATVVRRIARNQAVRPARAIVATCLAGLAVAVVAAITWQAVASSSAPTQMAAGSSLTIDGNGESKTIACNGGHLTVTGRDETITVTGHCDRISVDGVINHVTVDSVDAVDVDGINNVVTYRSGAPKITNSGGQNTVRQG